MSEQDGLLALCGRVAAQRLPRWAELPDLELYMDQVLSLIERYLGSYPGFDGRGLTASMVNNYVKLGVMPPPVRKKYTRVHLAYLIVICVLKASLPIDSIRNIVAASVLPEGDRARGGGGGGRTGEGGGGAARAFRLLRGAARAGGAGAGAGAVPRGVPRAAEKGAEEGQERKKGIRVISSCNSPDDSSILHLV